MKQVQNSGVACLIPLLNALGPVWLRLALLNAPPKLKMQMHLEFSRSASQTAFSCIYFAISCTFVYSLAIKVYSPNSRTFVNVQNPRFQLIYMQFKYAKNASLPAKQALNSNDYDH